MICYDDVQVPVVSDAACEASSSTEVTVGQHIFQFEVGNLTKIIVKMPHVKHLREIGFEFSGELSGQMYLR